MIKFTKLKNKNKNGFAMAELLAVCIVVLTIFTILFSNYLPLVAEYENRSVYNNVTAQYAAHHFRKAYAEAIAKTATKPDNQNIEKIISGGFAGDDYITVYDKDDNTKNKILEHLAVTGDREEIAKMLDEYEIEEIIITPYKLETLKDKYPNTDKLYGYINYLPTYKNYNDNGKEVYRIILKSSEFGYATTPIKYENVSSGEQDPNHPVLSENMFAVRYFTGTEGSECVSGNSCWKVVSGDEKDWDNWYNYDVGEWANSITVKDSVREEYKVLESNGVGKEVNMDDVLTMQVWIPRFNYKVWNYNSSGFGNENNEPFSIEINFEDKDKKTGDITCTPMIQGETGDGTSETCYFGGQTCTNGICNGKTYTHPAFTFGNKELTGFWVGKFELSSDTSCTPSSGLGIDIDCNLKAIRPLIKPNETAWRGAMVGTFENNIMAMNDDGNKYGFKETDDTHMIKNMEWGAIAYLSHSKYGINKKIGFNSNTAHTTGCGPQSSESTSWGSTCNGYDTTLGKTASTTGNIYGIYDMSGGAWEYVMGNMVNAENNNIISGHYNTDNSGYNGILYDHDHDYVPDNTLYEGIYTYPTDVPDKYVDKYSYGTTSEDSTAIKRSKLGDSIKEMTTSPGKGWHGDVIKMIYVASKSGSTEGNAWTRRGGGRGTGSGSSNYGLFSAESDSGGSKRYYTSRLVIAVLEE